MNVMSTPSRQKSWQTGRERVSVLAALAIQKDTVSRVLAELREQHRNPATGRPLSQEKAAARAGVTGRQWQRWESGESEPYLRNLEAVAEAFGFPVSRFLSLDEQDGATSGFLSLENVSDEFSGRVDQVDDKLDRIDGKLEHLDQALREASTERVGLVDQILDLLKQQSELLARQTQLIESLQSAADRLPDGPTLEDRLVQVLRDTTQGDDPPQPPESS